MQIPSGGITTNDEGEDKRQPERRLLLAVLGRAINDYIGTCPEERRSSLKWIDSDRIDSYSFHWVCVALDMCPMELRVAIKKYKKGG